MIDDSVKVLAADANFAAFTTLLPDGHPQTHVMWVDCDDQYVLINTETHRRKFKNVQRDPRVTVTVMDRQNPYHYAEVRGRVVETVTGPEARAHIDELSKKYTGNEYQPQIQSERVIVKIAPIRQMVHGR
jgi:PPOX class probable F420-dependent enzyme